MYGIWHAAVHIIHLHLYLCDPQLHLGDLATSHLQRLPCCLPGLHATKLYVCLTHLVYCCTAELAVQKEDAEAECGELRDKCVLLQVCGMALCFGVGGSLSAHPCCHEFSLLWLSCACCQPRLPALLRWPGPLATCVCPPHYLPQLRWLFKPMCMPVLLCGFLWNKHSFVSCKPKPQSLPLAG